MLSLPNFDGISNTAVPLSNSTSDNQAANASFIKEITILKKAAVGCDNIVTMRGVGHIDGKMCIVMEHMDKGSLSDILACRGGRLPEDVLFSVAKDCCVGLDYLHNTLKLIHGDLKPANILMSSSGQVAKISDFRVSSAQVAGRRECHGTLLYMSPEELRGEGGCGYLSDVWSLGLTLLECALGRFPYMAEVPKDDDKQIKERVLVDEGSVLSIDDDLDFWQLMEKIDNPPSLTALQRECGFSDKFLNFIDSCLQIDPTRRDSTTALLANKWFDELNGARETVIAWLE